MSRLLDHVNGKMVSIIVLFMSFMVVISGWVLTDKLIESKEEQLLAQEGKIKVKAFGTERDGSETSSGKVEDTAFIGTKLLDPEMIKVLEVWEKGGKEILHEPMDEQMDMEQAILAANEWIENFAESRIVFSPVAAGTFDKTTAKLCSYKQDLVEDNKISFWEVSCRNEYLYITLRIHAFSGEVWEAELEVEEDAVVFHVSDQIAIDTVFSYLPNTENKVWKCEHYSYKQIGENHLFAVLQKSELEIGTQSSIHGYNRYIFMLKTKIE